MDWQERTPEEKAESLSQQMEEIQRAKAVIERFERLTQKWLELVQPTKKEAQSLSMTLTRESG
ncbi:MAG: hypothetical protein ISS56_04865 [Anaerolineae bacterium]|nr:hypothetical protein [Anaerolineae bacterium]